MDSVIFSPPTHADNIQPIFSEQQQHQQLDQGALTVCRQVVDQQGQEGDEHARDDDVDHVEERFASNDKVEGDVLVLVALHGNVFVGVSLGWPVNDLPLAVLCRSPAKKQSQSLDTNWMLPPPVCINKQNRTQ